MRILIKNATLVSPEHPLHGKKTDLFIEDGLIKEIGNNLSPENTEMIQLEGLHVSYGWMDCFANFCDPGEEYKETIETGANAAATGGYTDVMIVPNTAPVVQNKSQIDYLITKAIPTPVTVHPIGAATQNLEGKSLAEIYDMRDAGAAAFSDGFLPIQSAGILQKALEYTLAFDGTFIQLPDDKSIGRYGLINEGVVSTRMGMLGKPAIAEELMVARDIELVKYTKSKIHFTGISTRKSIELIKKAKKEGLPVTCSVTPYHLFFSDENLTDYNTLLKVNPPLRTPSDRDALREAVLDGTVDFIASHHNPQDYDNKVCEFEKAKNGMETLETVFSAIRNCGIPPDLFVKMQTENIRKVFNLPYYGLKENTEAVLTLFNPDEPYTYSEKDLSSQCTNNAFLGIPLTGKVFGTINKDHIFLSFIHKN